MWEKSYITNVKCDDRDICNVSLFICCVAFSFKWGNPQLPFQVTMASSRQSTPNWLCGRRSLRRHPRPSTTLAVWLGYNSCTNKCKLPWNLLCAVIALNQRRVKYALFECALDLFSVQIQTHVDVCGSVVWLTGCLPTSSSIFPESTGDQCRPTTVMFALSQSHGQYRRRTCACQFG